MSGRNKREKKKNGSKKKPGSAAPHKTYSRGELGQSIFESCPDFNLDDPDMKLMSMEYNSLHDPHLKHFFNQRRKKKHLKKLGLITHDNKVLCTLKEFRDYMRYREALHLSCEKFLLEKQTYLLKHFIILKQKGEMPEAFSVSDMIDLLINKGMDTFRKM
ncbi:fibrous sheath-interacting protein 2-like [Tachysurus ichikawai]